jgi:hypothetical protein
MKGNISEEIDYPLNPYPTSGPLFDNHYEQYRKLIYLILEPIHNDLIIQRNFNFNIFYLKDPIDI